LHRRAGAKVHHDDGNKAPISGPCCFRGSVERTGLVRGVWPRPA
jgi:hypothetical protein